jgi:putative transposase
VHDLGLGPLGGGALGVLGQGAIGDGRAVAVHKSGANTAALERHNGETEAGIEIRQIKYLNNIVEQDHRAIKRLIGPQSRLYRHARRILVWWT